MCDRWFTKRKGSSVLRVAVPNQVTLLLWALGRYPEYTDRKCLQWPKKPPHGHPSQNSATQGPKLLKPRPLGTLIQTITAPLIRWNSIETSRKVETIKLIRGVYIKDKEHQGKGFGQQWACEKQRGLCSWIRDTQKEVREAISSMLGLRGQGRDLGLSWWWAEKRLTGPEGVTSMGHCPAFRWKGLLWLQH